MQDILSMEKQNISIVIVFICSIINKEEDNKKYKFLYYPLSIKACSIFMVMAFQKNLQYINQDLHR